MKRFWTALSFLILFGAAAAQAQTYPSRPITLVVPFPPGGSTDAAARIMAERMRATLGQSVVIENVGGAGGSIGVGRVARAAPDGYTFDIGQWDTHVGSIIYKLDYDLEKDFEPIALVSNNPQLLVAKNDLPANTLAELVAWMKDNPGKINFVNQNAAANVTGVMFENLTKQKVQFIPYRGAGPAMTDLISGTVDLLVVQGAVALPQIRAGKIKALANLSATRGLDAGYSDRRRSRRARPLCVRLVRLLGAQGHAEGCHRQAQRRDNRGAGRPRDPEAVYRIGARRRAPRTANAGRIGQFPEGRDRKMVADHQGRRDRRAGAVGKGRGLTPSLRAKRSNP
jgi:tripartite-type tricarboxylate transporter receptor subunit TctC